MLVMYEHSEKRMVERLRFDAGVHGIKLDGDDDTPQARVAPKVKGGVSGDPDSYSHLSKEERQRLTEEMMGGHKAWDQINKPLGGREGIDKR